LALGGRRVDWRIRCVATDVPEGGGVGTQIEVSLP
jgi:hypothetical protein